MSENHTCTRGRPCPVCYEAQQTRLTWLEAENRHLREELATWESVRMAMAERIGEAEEQNREMRGVLISLLPAGETENTFRSVLQFRANVAVARAWLAVHPEKGEEQDK